jgi:L-ascorbate metabolism protein UlaG (beta-lactamase superfamily)
MALTATEIEYLSTQRLGRPATAAAQAAVTWVGHASYVVQIGGLVVLTDPVAPRRPVGSGRR